MDISTFNVVVGGVLTFMGATVLFALGAILQYTRSIAKSMKEINERTIAHEVKIEGHDKWLTQVDDKIYKLNRAS